VTTNQRSTRDPSSVYRVVRIVATDPSSWERAAAHAVEDLAKSIGDLRVARVIERDAVVREGSVRCYRVKIEASYRLDRRRTVESGVSITTSRYLVVVNDDDPDMVERVLDRAVRERMQAGGAEFHLVVPAAIDRWASLGVGFADLGGSYLPAESVAMVGSRADAEQHASELVDRYVTAVRAKGVWAKGEVGHPDPAAAVAAVLERSSFDEIVLVKSPGAVSRWFKVDLASRLHRRFGLPVVELPPA
jgi:flavin-binding protein dodecin